MRIVQLDPAIVANFVLFQLGWLVSVIGAAHGVPLAGVAYAVAWVLLHHWYIRRGRLHELVFILASAGLGFVVDSLLVVAGYIAFPAYASIGFPSTVWMVCLWLMFAMTLRHSLGWLRRQYVLAAALGAVFGPLAYWAGSRAGAIHLNADSVPMIAVAWAASMIGLLSLERLTRLPLPGTPAQGGLQK